MGSYAETAQEPPVRRRRSRVAPDRCGLAELAAKSGQRLTRTQKLLDRGLLPRYSHVKNKHKSGVVTRDEAELLIPVLSSELLTAAVADAMKADAAAVLAYGQDLVRLAQLALNEQDAERLDTAAAVAA